MKQSTDATKAELEEGKTRSEKIIHARNESERDDEEEEADRRRRTLADVIEAMYQTDLDRASEGGTDGWDALPGIDRQNKQTDRSRNTAKTLALCHRW